MAAVVAAASAGAPSAEEEEEEEEEELAAWLTERWVLISQGAEARVYSLVDAGGRTIVAKHRFAKRYRVPELDARLRKEARCIARCREARIAVPSIVMVDTAQYLLYMEQVAGLTVKAFVDAHDAGDPVVNVVMRSMGEAIARLHDANLVHGDLTTSNFLAKRPAPADAATDDAADARFVPSTVVLIDFGLGSMNPTPEDKAVDLYVLERALTSTHDKSEKLLDIILDAYRAHFADHHRQQADAVLNRLESVRARGRKRECFG